MIAHLIIFEKFYIVYFSKNVDVLIFFFINPMIFINNLSVQKNCMLFNNMVTMAKINCINSFTKT